MGSPEYNRRVAKWHSRITPERAAVIAEATRLRAEGMSYQQVGDIMGHNKGQVYKWVQRGIKEIFREPTENARNLELDRLDALWRAAWRQLNSNFSVISHGKIVRDEATGEPVVDEAAKMSALDRCLKIQERRARLLGLDAPTRTQHLTMDTVDAEIQRLQAELATADATAVVVEDSEEEDLAVT